MSSILTLIAFFLFLSNILPLAWAAPQKHQASATDDCDFIRDALKKISTTGGEVLIPTGQYTCLAPIVLDQSNLSLVGKGDVTLKLQDRADTPVVIIGDIQTPPRHLRDIQISNLKIDGNRRHQTRECWGGPCDSGGSTFIRNNGITIRGVTNAKIKNVFVTGAKSGGVVTEKGCYGLQIDGLTSVDNEFDGFAGYETSRSFLKNMTLSHNQAAGISIDIHFNGNTIQNTKIEDNGDVGIFMRDSNSNLFDNLTLSDNRNHGVFLAQVSSQANCANDNEFLNLTVVRSNGFGFRLNNACEGNRLSGTAQFLQNREACISEGTAVALEIDGKVICEK